MIRRTVPLVAALIIGGAVYAKAAGVVVLPSGWRLSPATGPIATVGTMPQGVALSPNESQLAVVESGFNPAALRILNASDLSTVRTIPLGGAFGKPLWLDDKTVLVAGANLDGVLVVNAEQGAIARTIPIGKDTWPAAIALSPDKKTLAVANDGNATVSVVDLERGATTATYPAGTHPSDVVFSSDGKTLYVASRGESTVRAIALASGSAKRIAVGRHPAALARSTDGKTIFVAASDDDEVDTIDDVTHAASGKLSVAVHDGGVHGAGTLPNALTMHGDLVYVSLGGLNAVVVARYSPVTHTGATIATVPSGWYPSGIAVAKDGTIFVSDGKGEEAPPNPGYKHGKKFYVAAQTVGSIRKIPAPHGSTNATVVANAAPQWTPPANDRTVIRAHGPIRHVIYIIKENRSYDQVLGDIAGADGDPSLVWFGKDVTPNQHALSQRFGVFDNAYANSQVSADGHNWTDAAIANDYVERFWPPNYGGRQKDYTFQSGTSPDVPHNGYLWDAASRAGITYRDYGEDLDLSDQPGQAGTTDFPGLQGRFDPRYVGWNLAYSDLDRFAEWKREFDDFVRNNDLPSLEIVYLPNDHTSGTAPGKPTPDAYVATNDLAVGKLVEAVSHSPFWSSTAIFILEDDAQNGPDHVSDQRSTFYVASPYAIGGVQHDHYSTASVLHTIELILGLQQLSLYDTTALPMYAAFGTTPNVRPFDAIMPSVDMKAINQKTAYAAGLSARLNWHDPDEVNPNVLNDILAHAVGRQR